MAKKPTKKLDFSAFTSKLNKKGGPGTTGEKGHAVGNKRKNVLQARQDAINKVSDITYPRRFVRQNAYATSYGQRKNTLLVEYRQLRKSNVFLDKRILGEHTY